MNNEVVRTLRVDTDADTALVAVRDAVAMIAASAGDDEAAHSYEDQLHQAVLAWIALKAPTAIAEVAAAALNTCDIDFARWCA